MGPTATLAVGIAAVLDRAVAEPPGRYHPVAWFGRIGNAVDRPWRRPRLVGVSVALAAPLGAAVAAGGIVAVAYGVTPWFGAVVAGLVLFSTTSLRMLLDAAGTVLDRSVRDPDGARDALPTLAGRDPAALSPGHLRSAAVESLAENLSDGLVAPLLAFAALAPVSVAAGTGGAAYVKAVNTLDSQLGYRDVPAGWASARLDDVVMWIPARVTVLLLSVVAFAPGAVRSASRWAMSTPSPNAGWPMATIAALLEVRLEKPGVYRLRPEGELPTTAEGERALRIVRNAGALAWVGAGVIAWF